MCCKATLLPPDAYGPKAPEGSEEFRFRTIALKPAFILSQLKTTQQALTLTLNPQPSTLNPNLTPNPNPYP